MKKIFSALVVLAILLSLCGFAFAEDTKLTISGENREFDGYQLFTLTSALKDGEHHAAAESNHVHTDDCYVYSYTVNSKYLNILKVETFDNGGPNIWVGEKPANSEGVDEDEIKNYFESLIGDDKGGDSLRIAADRIIRAILAENIDADAKNLSSGSNNTIAQGYWMFVDVTDFDGEYDANSLVIVDTKNLDALTIAPKTALPIVEKKVKDIEDSIDNSINDNYWHDSADFDIGDTIPFKLTGTMAGNARAYETYEMIFHDTLSDGFTLDVNSFKVYMYGTKHLADVDTAMVGGTDVTDKFVVNTNPTDGCSFEVYCENVRAIAGATSGSAFVVYYEATIDNDVVIGKNGNPNTVWLEFSNDPYGDSTGKTKEDYVTVFTYELVITKIDSHGHALEGAGFTLWKYIYGADPADSTGITDEKLLEKYNRGFRPVGVVDFRGEANLDANGEINLFKWVGIDDGDYILSETTTPAGYNSIEDIEFSIDASHSETADDPILISINAGKMGVYDDQTVNLGTISMSIENKTGTALPSTGAKGTVLLIGIGAMLILVAGVFMVTRKKMSVYED